MRFPSPFSVAFLGLGGLLVAAALGAAAYWVSADDSPGLSEGSVAAGRPLSPTDEDGRVRTITTPVRTVRAIFRAECGGCHTLAAAGTRGTAGPDLDRRAPEVAQVRAQVSGGGGGMPAFGAVLSADEINRVAVYVAESARPPAPATTNSTPVAPPTRTDDSGGDDDSGKGRGRGRGGDDSRDD
jgi:mono/diheme cytochrome c family protein